MLRSAYEALPHFYVLNDRVILPPDMIGRTYVIAHAERDYRVVVNLWEARAILLREKPTVILSTGAGPIVPFALVAKVLRIPVVFVETIARVQRPSLTGRIMYRLADRFFYQWPHLAKFFPRGEYVGALV